MDDANIKTVADATYIAFILVTLYTLSSAG
jgi:hypothetical protein